MKPVKQRAMYPPKGMKAQFTVLPWQQGGVWEFFTLCVLYLLLYLYLILIL